MRRTRFCSSCGEPINTKSASFAVLGLLCLRCSPRFRHERVLTAGAFFLCLAVVFAIARYTAPREPFRFIGTRVESNADNLASAIEPASPQGVENSPASRSERPAAIELPSSPASSCNAPTKSGRPCQRRMKAGGFCWQHRDKFGAQKPAIDAR